MTDPQTDRTGVPVRIVLDEARTITAYTWSLGGHAPHRPSTKAPVPAPRSRRGPGTPRSGSPDQDSQRVGEPPAVR